jgi:hypothetical protein
MKPSPSIYSVRVVRMAKNLPANITLLFTGMPEPEPAGPQHIVVRVEFPDMTPYHTCIGRFMDQWSKLEIQLQALFTRLLGADAEKGNALASTMSGKAMIEALTVLSEATLPAGAHKSFINLMERLSAINTKRNYIVHGYWSAEIIVFNQRNGDVTMKMKVLREYPAPSPRTQQALADPKNQRERTKYLFQTKRIDEIAGRVSDFGADLAAFMEVEGLTQAPRAR